MREVVILSWYLSDWSACGRTACKVECSGCLGQIKWMIKAIMNVWRGCCTRIKASATALFLALSAQRRRKPASNEQNVENSGSRSRPFRLFGVIGRVCFFDFQKIKISSRPLAGGDAVSVNLCCTWKWNEQCSEKAPERVALPEL